MNKGDRVKVLSDYKAGNIEIKAGNIVTIVTVLEENDMVIIRYGYQDGRELIAGVSKSSLAPIILENLSGIPYTILLSKNYHIGNKLRLESPLLDYKVGDIFEITDVSYSLNESDDRIFLEEVNNFLPVQLPKKNVDVYFIPYNEEFEESLGKEVDLTQQEKNYYVVGARVKDEDDEVVIISEFLGDRIVCMDLEGEEQLYSKLELTPFYDNVELVRLDQNKVIPVKYRKGKRLIANQNISKHSLLNINFQPNDVIEIVSNNTVSINYHDDTYNVTKKGVNFVLSAYELDAFFEPYKGMTKTVVDGTVIAASFNKELEEIFKELYPVKDKAEMVEEEKKFNVRIQSLNINEHEFEIDMDGSVYVGFNVNEIDNFIEVLGELKKILKNS